MKQILFILPIFSALYSCKCPEITTSVVEKHDTIVQIDTMKVVLPPVFMHDTVNFSTLCDSVLRGFSIHHEHKSQHGTVKIDVDTTGKAVITCNTDSLEHEIAVLNRTINNYKSESHTQYIPKESWWQTLYKWGFWIELLLIALYLKFKR